MIAFEELKQRQGVLWGSAPFENYVHWLADMHDDLVERLDPKPGAWYADEGLRAVYERAGVDPQDPDPTRWSDEPHLRRLLGDTFDLELEPGVWRTGFDAPDDMWEFWSTAVPPFATMLRANGRIEFTREYVLVLGRRR